MLLNPLTDDPALKLLSVPILSIVNVPVPDKVPFRFNEYSPNVGLFPNGILQLLFIVLVGTVPVAVKVTKLRETLLQLYVSLVFNPPEFIVPPFALKAPPVTVKLPFKFQVPLGAVNVPELKENEPGINAGL